MACWPAAMSPYAERDVAGDVAVPAGRQRGRVHLERRLEDLGGLAEVVAGLERREVRVAHHRVLGEALVDPLDDAVDGPGVHPRDQAEREEVLRALGVARLRTGLLGRLDRDRGHRHRVHGERGERVVVERIPDVAGLLEVAGLERVGVDDDRRAGREVADVGLQRGGVHRDEQVGHVARGHDVEVGDVDLEARHPGDGPGGRPDLGRVVRQGGEVVAEGGADVGEAVADELHAVAGVAGEPDDHPLQGLRSAGRRCRVGHVTSFRPPACGRSPSGPVRRVRRSDRRSGRGHPVRFGGER